jgi:hypothetical protein
METKSCFRDAIFPIIIVTMDIVLIAYGNYTLTNIIVINLTYANPVPRTISS